MFASRVAATPYRSLKLLQPSTKMSGLPPRPHEPGSPFRSPERDRDDRRRDLPPHDSRGYSPDRHYDGRRDYDDRWADDYGAAQPSSQNTDVQTGNVDALRPHRTRLTSAPDCDLRHLTGGLIQLRSSTFSTSSSSRNGSGTRTPRLRARTTRICGRFELAWRPERFQSPS